MLFKEKNEVQKDLFNPLPDLNGTITVTSLYGKFIDKYNDKGLTIELLSEASYCITCKQTGIQQHRNLQSKIVIVVPENIYKHPFIKDKLYSISIDNVNEIILP